MTSRRQFLVLACSAVAAGAAEAQMPPNIEKLRREALEAAIRKVTGGAEVRDGRVSLDVPPLIDNGNSVPITVKVDSPMTPTDHVRAIHLFTEKNPQPYILTVRLGPRAGRAAITTRARIADTGVVLALAQLSDGSFWADRVSVLVTVSACLEDRVI